MSIVVKPLQLDRVEVSLRIGDGSIVPLQIVNDVIDYHVRSRSARPLQLYPFLVGNSLARHVAIGLSWLPKNTLTVATGTSSGRGNGRYQWVKFGFNPNKLIINDPARWAFLEVMNELLPGGGYFELLAGGNLIYAEFALDILNADIAALDAFCFGMDAGTVIRRDGGASTIYLNRNQGRSERSFAIYDKNRSDRETQNRRRRFSIVRVEARRRFNHNPRTRHLNFSNLSSIENPFSDLEIYDKEKVRSVFSAISHERFLEDVERLGLQQALSVSSSAVMQARRLRLLQRCQVSWWNPVLEWENMSDALRVFFLLGGSH